MMKQNYYQRGTVAPLKNGVYVLSTGKYARYDNGLWYKSHDSYQKAGGEYRTSDFMTPYFRIHPQFSWQTLQFVVFSENEYKLDGCGFWSNEDGWTNLEYADTFPECSIHQPLMDSRFITYNEALNMLQLADTY